MAGPSIELVGLEDALQELAPTSRSVLNAVALLLTEDSLAVRLVPFHRIKEHLELHRLSPTAPGYTIRNLLDAVIYMLQDESAIQAVATFLTICPPGVVDGTHRGRSAAASIGSVNAAPQPTLTAEPAQVAAKAKTSRRRAALLAEPEPEPEGVQEKKKKKKSVEADVLKVPAEPKLEAAAEGAALVPSSTSSGHGSIQQPQSRCLAM